MITPKESFALHRPEKILSRRVVIHMADDCMMTPFEVVRDLERDHVIPDGSWGWFQANGGITEQHISQARSER